MGIPRGRRLALILALSVILYGIGVWWVFRHFSLPRVSAFGSLLLLVAVVCQFGAKWMFGVLFREGADHLGRPLRPLSAFRAALVGAGVARLIPAGGAITPIAMAWSVRGEEEGTAPAALRAAALNYGAILLGTGGSLLWVRSRHLSTAVASGMFGLGVLFLVIGALFVFGAGRLATLGRILPRRIKRRVLSTLVDHAAGGSTQILIWSRLALESAALFFVMQAFGLHLTPSQTLAAFGTSQLVGGLPGAPGGMGVTEAGLVGVLTLFGHAAGDTVGPTIVYRVVSYWLPAIAGVLAGGLAFLRSRAATNGDRAQPAGGSGGRPEPGGPAKT